VKATASFLAMEMFWNHFIGRSPVMR